VGIGANSNGEWSVVRIVIESSAYRLRNIGDVAMIQVALRRVRSFWPDAAITMHCLDAAALRQLDCAASALDPFGARVWSAFPRALRRLAVPFAADYLDAVSHADLVLVAGAGSLNDSFRRHALRVLDMLELAVESGAVTALAGQGLGPMTDRRLRARAAEVLPRAGFIALREGVAGLPLLASMGVPSDIVTVTGDDAIAPAFAARPDAPGSSIGVNLRVAPYSGVGADLVRHIGAIVREAADRYDAPLVPLPISRIHPYADADTIRAMTGVDSGDVSTLAGLLSLLRECRIVIAGSYHAAVLALSMGIPAVTIAQSGYYVDKFRGLAAQFGPACRLELASHPDFPARLRAAIVEAWASAATVREPLLESAARQIASGEAAYRRIFELVEERQKRTIRNRS
jgi:colanic acid/amylovoran biosynthesis protein